LSYAGNASIDLPRGQNVAAGRVEADVTAEFQVGQACDSHSAALKLSEPADIRR